MRQILAAIALFCALAYWLLVARGSFGVSNQWVLDPNAQVWPRGAFLLALGVLLIFGGAAALSAFDRFKRAKSDEEKRNSTLTALFCLAITLFLWPWALLGPGAIGQTDSQGRPPRLTLEGRFNIIAAQWSDLATEYFGAAYQIQNPREFGREYARKWQNPPSRLQAHLATHPPGATLFFYGARRAYESASPLQSSFESLAQSLTGLQLGQASELAGTLRLTSARNIGVPDPAPLPVSAVGAALWSAFLLGFSLVLALPAVYGLATGGEHSDEAEKRGLFAVALWVLAPTTNLFAFTLDAPIAAGAVWTLFLVARALQNPNPKRARLAMLGGGVLLALTSFLSFGALAVGAIAGLTLFLFRRDVLIARGAEMLLAFSATWAVLALVFAFNPFQVFSNAMEFHRYATLAKRSHLAWAGMNLVMWAPFAGFALLVCGVRRLQIAKLQGAGAQIGLAALGVLLLLSLSGNVRGEVERLWLFALAPVAIYAAFAPLPTKTRTVLLGLQAAQTVLMAATLGPLVRP